MQRAFTILKMAPNSLPDVCEAVERSHLEDCEKDLAALIQRAVFVRGYLNAHLLGRDPASCERQANRELTTLRRAVMRYSYPESAEIRLGGRNSDPAVLDQIRRAVQS